MVCVCVCLVEPMMLCHVTPSNPPLRTYDILWQEAMTDLGEQVHIEHVQSGGADGAPAAPGPQISVVEAFQHYACLYINYMRIFARLEACYDSMVHPQKRIDVKLSLELVIRRVVELKHMLVKWNLPNPDVRVESGAVQVSEMRESRARSARAKRERIAKFMRDMLRM